MPSHPGFQLTKRIQIFRAGKFTAMDGKDYEFSSADLQAAVAAYDPKLCEAQLVAGHPKHDDPSFGQVASLHFCANDNSIEMESTNVEPHFAEMVNTKRFPNRSASWYLPNSPGNPKPGSLYLRHVGFLGAVPPAIKGLRAASFAGASEGVVEFADWQCNTIVSMFRALRDWLIETSGTDKADKILPAWQLQSLENSASDADANSSIATYSESLQEPGTMTPAELKAQQDKLAADQATLASAQSKFASEQASFAERSSALTQKEKTAASAAHAAFVKGLVGEGKVLAVFEPGLVAFLSSIDQTVTIEFAEGTETKKPAMVDFVKDYLSKQPKVVSFGEDSRASTETESVAQFAAPAGYTVDADQEAIHTKAIAFQKANKDCNYADAVKAVSN